jgi:hypothetical protein
MLRGIKKSLSGLNSRIFGSSMKTITSGEMFGPPQGTQYQDLSGGTDTDIQSQIEGRTSNSGSQAQFYEKDTDESKKEAGASGSLSDLKDVLTEIAYDIKSIGINTLETVEVLREAFKPSRDDKIAGAEKTGDVDDGKVDDDGELPFKIPELSKGIKFLLGAAGFALLLKFSDKFITPLANVLKFIKKDLIPALGELNKIITDTPGGYFTLLSGIGLITTLGKFFGAKGKLTNLFKSVSNLMKSGITQVTKFGAMLVASVKNSFLGKIVSKAFRGISKVGKQLAGVIKTIGNYILKPLSFISKISGLSTFLKLGLAVGKAIPFLGQIILVIQGLFGFITGAIEGFKTGGITGAITGALIGLYDGVVGNFLNMIKDVIAWVLSKFGLDGASEFIGNLDFSFDGLKSAFFAVVDIVKQSFHFVVESLKKTGRGLIELANIIPGVDISIPKFLQPKEYVSSGALETAQAQVGELDAMSTQYTQPTAEQKAIFSGGLDKIKGPITAKDLDSNVQMTGKEFGELFADKTDKPPSTTIIQDNSTKSNTTQNKNTTETSSANTTHSDSTAAALAALQYAY